LLFKIISETNPNKLPLNNQPTNNVDEQNGRRNFSCFFYGNIMVRLLKLLGKLGNRLPVLRNHEWDNIFEFLEYFMIVKNEKEATFVDFNWTKVKEILSLLGKIQD
jgi:hypothetical protein